MRLRLQPVVPLLLMLAVGVAAVGAQRAAQPRRQKAKPAAAAAEAKLHHRTEGDVSFCHVPSSR